MREDGLKVMYNRKYFLKMHFFGCDVFRLGQKKTAQNAVFFKERINAFLPRSDLSALMLHAVHFRQGGIPHGNDPVLAS